MALPGMVMSAVRNFKRAWPLMRDERVPVGLKAGTAITAILIVSPLDIFSDIPILGMLDDAVLLTLLCMLFVRIATPLVGQIHREAEQMKNVTPERRDIGGPPAPQ
jgi:uncharacterized membrane protein YkvA (DUF1232 family)